MHPAHRSFYNNEYYVDFYKGSPGALPLLLEAGYFFPEMGLQLFDVAAQVGEVTWKEGLLLKGNGLCTGISGNGYMLHSLYRAWALLAAKEPDLEKK